MQSHNINFDQLKAFSHGLNFEAYAIWDQKRLGYSLDLVFTTDDNISHRVYLKTKRGEKRFFKTADAVIALLGRCQISTVEFWHPAA